MGLESYCMFYSALHLINAHVNKKTGLNYKSHEEISVAINPNTSISLSKLPEFEYVAYISLQNLSRRSRYLLNDSNRRDNTACFTTDLHYKKAIKNLQIVIDYFEKEYNESIFEINIFCPSLTEKFKHFQQ
ncbi:MAG: hypothetical protein RJA25_1143 [Bacteroidota bacterium]